MTPYDAPYKTVHVCTMAVASCVDEARRRLADPTCLDGRAAAFVAQALAPLLANAAAQVVPPLAYTPVTKSFILVH